MFIAPDLLLAQKKYFHLKYFSYLKILNPKTTPAQTLPDSR